MSQETKGKLTLIHWLFGLGLILIFIAVISILAWRPQVEIKKNIRPGTVKEYTPKPAPPKKPIYRPLPEEKPKAQSKLQSLPQESEEHQSKYQELKE